VSKEFLDKPVGTPEEIVGLIGNIGNRPDQREVQQHQVNAIKEYAAKAVEEFAKEVATKAEESAERLRGLTVGVVAKDPAVSVDGKQLDIFEEGKLNAAERDFGYAWTEEELAKHFGEAPPVSKPKKKPLHEMTIDEIESAEKAEDNSNDIYKISARVKNLARGGNANLTPMGDMLCNSYTHVLKAFYAFAETLNQPAKDALVLLIRKHEDMPGNVISAAGVGVKTRKR